MTTIYPWKTYEAIKLREASILQGGVPWTLFSTHQHDAISYLRNKQQGAILVPLRGLLLCSNMKPSPPASLSKTCHFGSLPTIKHTHGKPGKSVHERCLVMRTEVMRRGLPCRWLTARGFQFATIENARRGPRVQPAHNTSSTSSTTCTQRSDFKGQVVVKAMPCLINYHEHVRWCLDYIRLRREKTRCGTHKTRCGTHKTRCGTHKTRCGTHKTRRYGSEKTKHGCWISFLLNSRHYTYRAWSRLSLFIFTWSIFDQSQSSMPMSTLSSSPSTSICRPNMSVKCMPC